MTSTTSRCNRPGCGGSIDETGFCDRCSRLPLRTDAPHRPGGQPASTHPTTLATDMPADTGQSWMIADLVSLPVLAMPEPSSQVLSNPQVPESSRVCSHCHGEVGRSYAGQPALLVGYCPQCETRFSFIPKLRHGDLVAEQYEVVGCVARGGLGWVYLARDTHLDGNYVALKGLITSDEVALKLAVAERRFLTAIDHPNIVRIFNSVTHRDPKTGERSGYIVMEYLAGQSLDEVRRAAAEGRVPLPIEHVVGFGHEILAALAYLHERGMLYCDMKPANVIRCRDRVKIIDIGGVRRTDDTKSPMVGTPGYQIAPSEFRARGLTVRSDIHTVGKTLEELLVVSQVGPAPTASTAADDVSFTVESFWRLVARSTTAYDGRFATAAEMSQQLRGVLRELQSLRTGRPHPAPSTVFTPTPVLLDGGPAGGLGAVPGLESWIRRSAEPLDVGLPAATWVAGGLPVPLTDPDDPAARLLTTTGAQDPRSMIEKLSTSGEDSVEIQLALCRAHADVGEQAHAEARLKAAGAALGDRAPHDWRMAWHRALLHLGRPDVAAARKEFDAVYGACPGEIAPKLALGYCAEYLGRSAEAARYYEAIWRRDQSEGSAAFGLARIFLSDADRAGAVAILDEVPRLSRHYDKARIAAVRILCGRLPSSRPSRANVREAEQRLETLHLDGGNETGEIRDRLRTLIQMARLDQVTHRPDSRPWTEDGRTRTEDDLRRGLERSLRALAEQARTIDDHGALVDLANAVRPKTRW